MIKRNEGEAIGDFCQRAYKEGYQVIVDGDAFYITVYGSYCIPFEKVNTPEMIIKWVNHLCEKTAITTAILEDFLEMSCSRINLKLHPF